MIEWTDRWRDRIALVIFGALIVVTVVSVTWLLRQSYAVYRLTRGVGDTWFLAADGRPWFRLDEQRHDVQLNQIPTHLQHAFIAVEDHRFITIPVSIRLHSRAPCSATCANRERWKAAAR